MRPGHRLPHLPHGSGRPPRRRRRAPYRAGFSAAGAAADASDDLADGAASAVHAASSTLAGHAALQRLLAEEPGAVLPFISFDRLGPLLARAAGVGPRALRAVPRRRAGRDRGGVGSTGGARPPARAVDRPHRRGRRPSPGRSLPAARPRPPIPSQRPLNEEPAMSSTEDIIGRRPRRRRRSHPVGHQHRRRRPAIHAGLRQRRHHLHVGLRARRARPWPSSTRRPRPRSGTRRPTSTGRSTSTPSQVAPRAQQPTPT